MAKNDIYLVKQNTDGTWQEIPVGDNLGDSPMTYDDNFTLHVNTKLRVDELEVNGLTTVKDQDITTSEQLLITNDGTGTAVVINQIGLDGLIDIQDDGETALFIRGDNAFGGFVGLGTKEAQEQLHITGSMLLEHQQLIMSYNDADTKTPLLGINGGNFTELSNVGSGIKLSTGDSTTSPKLTILENGDVGIGTENPLARLQIETVDNTTIYNPTNSSPPTLGDCLLALRNDYTGEVKAGTFAGLQLNVTGGVPGQNAIGTINLVIEEDSSPAGALTFSPSSSSSIRPEAMRINSLGYVGIGTTDPKEPLHIETGSDTVVKLTQVLGSSGNDQSHISFYTKDDTNESLMGRMGIFTDPDDSNVDEALFLNSHDTNNIVFRTGSATRMLIQNGTGNVGIGTTSPELATLHITTDSTYTINLQNDASNKSGIIFSRNGTPNASSTAIVGNGETDGYIDFFTSGSSQASAAMRINSDGNVGIGTTSPDALLHLEHSQGAAVDGFYSLKLKSPDPTILLSDSTNTGDMSIMWQAAPTSTGISGKGGLRFYRDSDVDDVDFMIDVDGNVGIGTTNPGTNKLKIVANHSGAGKVIHAGSSEGKANGFVLQGNGNVGIGTTSPQRNLDIYDTGGSCAQRIWAVSDQGLGTSSMTGAWTEYGVKIAPGADGAYFTEDDLPDYSYTLGIDSADADTSSGSGSVHFPKFKFGFSGQKWSGPGDMDRDIMVLQPNGNVGIGTTNPAARLTIAQPGTTIGGNDISKGCFLAGTSTDGIGIDDNEIVRKGGDLVIGVSDTDSTIHLRTNLIDRFVVDNNTTTVNNLLQAQGGMTIATNDDNNTPELTLKRTSATSAGGNDDIVDIRVGDSTLSFYINNDADGDGGSYHFYRQVNNNEILAPAWMSALNIEGNVVHSGDSDTYFGFHANNEWRVVTGGAERIEVTDTMVNLRRNTNVTGDFDVVGAVNITASGSHATNPALQVSSPESGVRFFDSSNTNSNTDTAYMDITWQAADGHLTNTRNGLRFTRTGPENADFVIHLDGSATFSHDLTIQGDLTVNGDLVTLNTTNLSIEDKVIQLAKNATSNALSDESGIAFGSAAQLLYDNTTDALYVKDCAGFNGAYIKTNTITATQIANNTITALQIGANAVGSSELADDAVDTAAVANKAITGAKIADNTIGAGQIAANAVGSSELADDAVDTAAVANKAITGAKIADKTITGAKIADNTIGAGQIAANAVGSSEIAAGAVGSSEIAADAVGSSEIAANAVGASELNVTGNGTSGQVLKTDGDGTFSWVNQTPAYSHPTFTAGSAGSSTEIPVITVNTEGHVTALTTQSVSIPSSTDFVQTSATAQTMQGHLLVKGQNSSAQSIVADFDIVAMANASDERLKENVVKIDSALEKVCSLEGFYFDWNNEARKFGIKLDRKEVGLSAQATEKVLPEAVKTFDNSDYKYINYEKLVPVLVEAIKDLKSEIEELKKNNCGCN